MAVVANISNIIPDNNVLPQARRIYPGQQCAFAGMTRKWDSSDSTSFGAGKETSFSTLSLLV